MVEDGKFITHIVELGGNGEIHLLGAIRGQLDGAAVGGGDAVDDTNQRGFSGTVRYVESVIKEKSTCINLANRLYCIGKNIRLF